MRKILPVILVVLFFSPLVAHAAQCVNGKILDDAGADTGQTCVGSTPQTADQAVQASAAYQFQNEGIFGCNQIAGVNMSVGTMAAIGGVYVPVNDAAVTVNTGTLVYLQCILRPLVDRLRESASSALFKKTQTAISSGRQGNQQYVVNYDAERGQVEDRSTLASLQSPMLDAAGKKLAPIVKRYVAQEYMQGKNSPQSEYSCPDANIEADLNNQGNAIRAILAESNPSACIPLYQAMGLRDLVNSKRAQDVANWEAQITAGRGFYPVTDNASDPGQTKILTPASVVQESYQNILNSPVRQLESANDIGQMIGALFAGVATQVISDSKGLAGLTQSVGGQPSYLDQVAKESSQGVVGAATNAALSILNGTRQVEASFLASMNAIATTLTNTIAQLRSTEQQCWNLIVPKAKDYAAQQNCTTDNTVDPPVQTCTGGYTLDPKKIAAATSSRAFSQQVIDSQVTPLASVAVQNTQSSQKALSLIDQLIAGVTNTTSLDAQRISLQQLDSLVAQKALHTQYDSQRAAQQSQDVQGAMTNLVGDTAKAWGDSPDPSVGWCNVNNQTVIKLWAERWKK